MIDFDKLYNADNIQELCEHNKKIINSDFVPPFALRFACDACKFGGLVLPNGKLSTVWFVFQGFNIYVYKDKTVRWRAGYDNNAIRFPTFKFPVTTQYIRDRLNNLLVLL